MSIENAIPQIWSSAIQTAHEKATVYGGFATTEFQGSINPGGSVKIIDVGEPDVHNYEGTDITFYPMKVASQTLDITEDKYVTQAVDDLDKAQAVPGLFEKATMLCGNALRKASDSFLAGLYTQAGITSGLGTTAVPLEIDKAAVDEFFALVSLSLDEADVPEDGRFIIVPPWLRQKMVLAKIISDTNNSEVLTNGKIARYMGFDVAVSNNVAKDSTTYKIFAGLRGSFAFVSALDKVEFLRPEKRFEDAVKMRYVFGGKVHRPDSLAVISAIAKAET